jgi:hypothetical protein
MRNAAFVLGVVILAIAGFLGYESLTSHHAMMSRDQLAAGYATQSLGAPFKLQSKTWHQDTGQWEYRYTTQDSLPDATTAAKSQLARGAYQVNAHHPDVVGSQQATLYRDLITEDVSIIASIAPNPAAGSQNSSTLVTVTLRPMTGGN